VMVFLPFRGSGETKPLCERPAAGEKKAKNSG